MQAIALDQVVAVDGFEGFDRSTASDECEAGVRSCLPNLSNFDATVACRFNVSNAHVA